MKICNGEKRNVARRETRIKLMTTIGDVCIKGEESGDKRRGRLILRDAMEIRVDTSNPLCMGYTRTRIIPRLHEAVSRFCSSYSVYVVRCTLPFNSQQQRCTDSKVWESKPHGFPDGEPPTRLDAGRENSEIFTEV